MVDANRKLVGLGLDLGGCRISSCSVGPLRVVGQRISDEDLRDLRVNGDQECVAWESGGIEPLTL